MYKNFCPGTYYIDVKTAFGSISSIHTDDDAASNLDHLAHFNIVATLSSAFEHGILEQKMGSDKPGISTIKLFQVANAAGHKVFFADNTNFSTIRPQMTNYSATTLNNFQSQVSQGRTLVLPSDGRLGVGDWKGIGYITKRVSGNSMSLGMVIGGGYYGGYVAEKGDVSGQAVKENTGINTGNNPGQSTAQTRVVTHDNPYARDPVEMAGGSFFHDRTDLVLGGQAPLGLSFTRSYISSKHLDDRGMGNGWTHNYDISLSRLSHGNPGLGMRQPVDAAALISALYINLDLMRNQDDIKGWMVTSLINKWAVDQLIDNAVSVRLGNKSMEFIKLSNGSYAAPPGITTELVDNGTSFSLVERFGTTMDFNGDDTVSQITDIHGNSLTFTYASDKLSSVTDAFGRFLTLTYGGDRLSSVADASGRSVSIGYNDAGDLTTVTDPADKVWSYGYDADHRMTTLANPLTITTASNIYDSLGRVKTQTVPRQTGTTVYDFYFSGFRNLEKDEQGNETIYYFDDRGRSTGVENALGHESRKVYDGQDHLVEVMDPRLNTTLFQYDGAHNLTKVIDNDLNENVNTYDSQNRLTQTIDPLDHATGFTYNNHHQVTASTVSPATGVTLASNINYLANGLVSTTTDPRQVTTTMTYDAFGNPATSRIAEEPAVSYDYDAVGRMTGLTDQAGTETTFALDPRNLLLTRTDGLGNQAAYTYYDNGLVHTATDRNNDMVTYTYTPTGKVETVSWPDGTTISYIYNALDRLTSMTDATGTTLYTYDALGQLVSRTDSFGFTTEFSYDEAGNLTTLTYPGDKQVTYTYDDLNRLHTVTDWLDQTATYTYDAAGRLTGLQNFNNTVTSFGHDNANRLTSLVNARTDNTVIASFAFTLDPSGNRISINEDLPLAAIPGAQNASYVYNTEKNRLEEAGSVSFTHDLEGQLVTKGSNGYGFDHAHRLKTVTGNNPASFVYDGAGNRIAATRNGVTTRYIYDPAGNLLATADENNTILGYFVYGQGLLAMVTPDNQTYCYHFDGTGNTVAMTDSSQYSANSYAYTPFGMTIGENETVDQPFKYVGQFGVMAEPDNLYYMKARYYDADTGRFISEDPIGFEGGINLYAYCLNNPINAIDPFGLKWEIVDTDYHGGTSTWKCTSLWAAELIKGGMQGGIPDLNYVRLGLSRTTTQMWVHDPENPDLDDRFSIGTTRIFDQQMKQYYTGPNDLASGPTYNQWTPYHSDYSNIQEATYSGAGKNN
jgi:RHS repeat-associated protein